MDTLRQEQLVQRWLREEQQPFTGWDFSYLAGRMSEDHPPWSYEQRAAALMQDARAVLDIDTGGGERLLELRSRWPQIVIATEGYPPNIRLAAERLRPHDAWVIPMQSSDTAPLPFADGAFDLVLNRHGSFNAAECARVLAPGGVFLTRQVHGLWAQDLLTVFGATPQWPDSTPEKYIPRLQASGLNIINVQDWQGRLRYTDVGAVVYYLKAVPWLVPGFSVASHQTQLMSLQARLDAGEELTFTARVYLIEAQKS
jgi:SAM-dependent methyltransferase